MLTSRCLGAVAEAARLLAQSESLEGAFPELVEVIDRVVPLRALVLVEGASPRQITSWIAPGAPRSEMVRERRLARTLHDQLLRVTADGESAPPTRQPPTATCALPLLGPGGALLGLLRLTGASTPSPADRRFLEAVAGAVALALLLAHERRLATAGRARHAAGAADNAQDKRDRVGAETRASAAVKVAGEARLAIEGRDAVLATIAHELRNPLGAVLLHCELLLESSRARELTQDQRGLEAIARATRRMRLLVEDLLDAASIDAAELRMTFEPTSLIETAVEVRDLFAPVAAKGSVALALAVPADMPAVSADQGRIAQVLSNLVGNAIRFTKPGGTVTVGAEVVGDEAAITVTDTGIGIPAVDLAHVFERYWHTKTNRSIGTGLGLGIARGIVEAHGGALSLESVAGRGATFTFTLPLASSARQPPDAH